MLDKADNSKDAIVDYCLALAVLIFCFREPAFVAVLPRVSRRPGLASVDDLRAACIGPAFGAMATVSDIPSAAAMRLSIEMECPS
jgi:hypothetical protein